MPSKPAAHSASYRDPAGFVFKSDDIFYRQVNQEYAGHYDLLMSSGLYEILTRKTLLISHTELPAPDLPVPGSPPRHKLLLPRQLPFVSYPSEWSPAQLKDAALLTLQIMLLSMDQEMILKDATPLNIQFIDGHPLFIDTLSFEKYDPSRPWIAYRQFCETFLFPLLLHHYQITGTAALLNAWPEGIPAEITARLLPLKSRLRLGVWLHVILQSRIGRKTPAPVTGKQIPFSRQKLLHLLTNLRDIVNSCRTHEDSASTWNHYYASTILSKEYLAAKENLFRSYITDITFASALDLGANDGYFSYILAEKTDLVIAADADWQCIGRLYRSIRENHAASIIPLCIDLANPTPATGFQHTERTSFTTRASAPLVTALALVHHLAIGRNIPLGRIASWFAELTETWLIIEFVPPEDEKTKELLRHKENFHKDYNVDSFTRAFSAYFSIEKHMPVPGTQRILYLMKRLP